MPLDWPCKLRLLPRLALPLALPLAPPPRSTSQAGQLRNGLTKYLQAPLWIVVYDAVLLACAATYAPVFVSLVVIGCFLFGLRLVLSRAFSPCDQPRFHCARRR